jgi:hypothetical protein
MSFLHASLLIGSVLAVIPIAMHLLGRRQPKTIVFPALRFVRQTAIHAQRGWSIKRWLLLALRVLLILILAFAFASPRVQSGMFATYLMIGVLAILALLASATALTAWGARRSLPIRIGTSLLALGLWILSGSWLTYSLAKGGNSPLPTASGPICVAVVIDTSPSMGYRFHNVTRLEAAKEMAMWLMDRLPVGSQIAIVNSDSGVRLNQDRLSANRLLDRTIVEGKSANLTYRISASIDALRKSDLERREIYVLSDLSSTAWRDAAGSDIPTKLAANQDPANPQANGVLVQLIDVSVPQKEKRNWSLGNFQLSQQSATPGSQVTISAELMSYPGSGNEQIKIELAAEDATVNPLVRDTKSAAPKVSASEQQMLEVTDGGVVPFRFTLKNLVEGTNHFEVRIARPDPLEIDNVWYGTVEARTQGQTLVVADNEVEGKLACYAIDPLSEIPNSAAGNRTTAATEPERRDALTRLVTSAQLVNLDLTRYSSLVLYETTGLTADLCDRIALWVEQGGGLLIVLGPAFDSAEELMENPIARLLPGRAKRITRRAFNDRSISLVPSMGNHPIWSIFDQSVEEIPWIKYAVFRHWDIEDLADNVSVLMRFTQSELPALLEQPMRQGRVITMAIPYPGSLDRERMWSQLYEEWPGFALFHGTVRYLSAWNQQQLNYFVDEPVVLENNISQFPQLYMLTNPVQEDARVESSNESLFYNFTRFPGQYRLRGSRPQGPVVRGFSVNVNRQEVSLDRANNELLDQALGKDQYRIAREKTEVQSSLGEGRYGRDLAPFLMLVFVLATMAEQVMSSRFYATSKKAAA